MFWGGILLSTQAFGFENGFSLTGTCTVGDTFCRSVGSDHCAWWNNPSVCDIEHRVAFPAVPTHEQSFPCGCGRVRWQQRGMTFTNGKYCTSMYIRYSMRIWLWRLFNYYHYYYYYYGNGRSTPRAAYAQVRLFLSDLLVQRLL